MFASERIDIDVIVLSTDIDVTLISISEVNPALQIAYVVSFSSVFPYEYGSYPQCGFLSVAGVIDKRLLLNSSIVSSSLSLNL